MIYPEGTTATSAPDHSPGRGRTGVARLARMTGVPVLPVATWGGQYVAQERRQSLAFGRPIWLLAGEPMDVGSGDANGAAPGPRPTR